VKEEGYGRAELWPPKQGLTIMIILGLFLIHLAESVAAFVFIGLLARWFGSVTVIEAVLTFAAISGAVATMIVLVANGRGGVIIAVAVIVFWSFMIFGTAGATAMTILAVAATVLLVAAAMVLAESFLERSRAARNQP
jgi:hypothetical protein